MTRQELIAQCRYYKGEEECPFEPKNMKWFWDMERVYVGNLGVFDGEKSYYEHIKGKRYPGIPYALLMVMFTSWAKYAYYIEKEIGEFYDLVDEYLFIPNDYIPEDKIPGQ